MADMNGQVALVTGGVRGIGLAICERLAARGVTVAAGYSRDKETAQRFLDSHPEGKASVHQGNIGSNEDCERVVARGAGPARPVGHPGQQRRDHDGQHGPEDDPRRLGPRGAR